MKIKADKNLASLSPKKFILNHLIPFIMRDAGRGFAMNTWKSRITKRTTRTFFDGIERIAPVCGTVACIGGSIECLTGSRAKNGYSASEKAAKLLGITQKQAHGLFFGFAVGEGGWPEEYAKKFGKSGTSYKKAQVACSLLRQIAKKGSKALPNKEVEYY